MPIVDLSHEISSVSPPYPGDPVVEMRNVFDVPQHGFRVRALSFGSHQGTHFDAPAHVFEGGKFLEEYPLERFDATARKVDLGTLRPQECVGVERLRTHERAFDTCDHILLWTHWAESAESFSLSEYFRSSPFLSREAAEWIASKKIALLGLDIPSPDAFGDENLPSHRALLEADTLLLENLCRLGELPEGDFFRLTALPLPLAHAEGSPARAIARWGAFLY
ncbi:MAG: cyclase family protein [Planctomycetia bacterium]|nr:cyclase family protein [Planctomycetia bacterium]